MSIRIGSVVHDVTDLDRAVAFWTAALDLAVRRRSDDFVILGGHGVNVSLQLAEHPKGEAWNAVHLDLYADDREAEVARLAALGATPIWRETPEGEEGHVVMRDPDGNEFCVCG